MSATPGKAKATPRLRRSDAALIAECLKGQESGWAALVDKYKNLIFSIPMHYGFSHDESADIFQTVCMDLLVELPKLREPKALAGWLIQVTRNKCFHRKQSLSRSKVQEIGDLDPPADPDAEPEMFFFQAQKEHLLREVLAEMPAQCRRLVEMLFFETPARPYDQVARELRLARGSVGFVRRSCLDKLKERLETLGY